MRSANQLTAEGIAYWYLRLNGFLLLENFLVHGDRGSETRTDIDLLGVRFPFRREHLARPMADDTWIDPKRIHVVFCDAKKGAQDLNDTWAAQDRKVMESFLALVGIIPDTPPTLRAAVVANLYKQGKSEAAEGYLITTLLMHHDPDGIVVRRWPNAPRVLLSHALKFVHDRFGSYEEIKTDHGQWQPSGHRLWDKFEEHRLCRNGFVEAILREIGATNAHRTACSPRRPSECQ